MFANKEQGTKRKNPENKAFAYFLKNFAASGVNLFYLFDLIY
jgi:hypothetical protein